jgi:hypothetical protein
VEAEKTVSCERINSTFKDGIAGDVSRLVKGAWYGVQNAPNGVFTKAVLYPGNGSVIDKKGGDWYEGSAIFDSGNVVPTASEGSPRTLSERFWRRVA